MRTARLVIVAVGLGLALPAAAAAQSPTGGDGWWSWALPSVARGEPIRTARGGLTLPWPGRDRDDDRDRRRADGKGPKFCRNGEGHPVHGRRWCAEKGFGRYSDWRRIGWEDVILRGPRRR
ncbi:MAG: hypothetical protein GWN71_18260, partial [Gammaproteobacteria bacterium]|nr:hypothetical protein [Gemmatimonadota bacterium]NIU75445.1 hypothetical protein [Gammaproteobacteria bacterium]